MLVLALLGVLALASARPGDNAVLPPSGFEFDGVAARASAERVGVSVEIDVRGVAVADPRAGWRVDVRTRAIGRRGVEADVGPADRVVATADRVELRRAACVEWFRTAADGVEQGWDLLARPAGSDALPVWIGIEFAGLRPQIAEDARSARLVDAQSRPRLVYRGLRAWDATGRELVARMTTRASRFGIEVEDRGAAYPITVDPVLGPGLAVFETNQAGAGLRRATPVGRVLGIYNQWLLAAAPAYDDGANVDAGRVYLLSLGGPSTLTVGWETSGPGVAGARFGETVAGLGDIDGDGFDDFAVSAPGWSNPEAGEGAVFVYRGTAAGPVLHWTIEGNSVGAALRLGEQGYAGDVNGDGRRDLVLLAGTGAAAIEELRVYAGSAGAVPTLLWTLTENDLVPHVVPADESAFTFSGGFDANADGIDDLALGAPGQFGAVGRAFLMRGFATAVPAPPPAPAWIGIPPGAPSASRFGASIALVGDLDGNGFADLAVGADRHPGDDTGAVFLFLANPIVNPATVLPLLPSQTLTGAAPGAFLGRAVASAGDFDGDGHADLLVGAATSGAELAIHRGIPGGVTPTAAWTQGALQVGSGFGAGLGAAGDPFDDGQCEVWVSAPTFTNGQIGEGSLYLFAGRVGPDLVVTPGAGATSFASTPGTGFGAAFALGDVNGDGLQDLLVGEPDWSNGQLSEGRLALYLTDAVTGFSATPAWTYESDAVGARLGASVAVAGDVQNDGFEDVLAGAPGWSNGQAGEGRALLFRGTASGSLGASPAWTFESDEAGAELGTCVSRAGDLDRDGLADVAVGAPGVRAGQVDRGAVYVFHGVAADALDLAPRIVLDPVQPGSRFGAALAFGDAERDDFDDLAVGAPANTSGAGSVFVFRSAGTDGLDGTFVRIDGTAGAGFGSALAFAGDLDADGASDLLVGAPGFVSGSSELGAVELFRGIVGVGLATTPAQTLLGTQHQAGFGSALAWIGDLDADGFGDVIVGSPAHDGAFVDGGRVDVFTGASTVFDTTPAWTLEGSAAGARLGAWVDGNADFDGDGFSDLAYGLPGSSEILIGGGGAWSASYFGSQQRRMDDARAVSILGSAEIAGGMSFSCTAEGPAGLSATAAGRQDVRLTLNVLDDASLQSSAFADTGFPFSAPIVRSVARTGLALGSAYRWQARLEFQHPLFPHSRWLGIQGNGKRTKKFVSGRDCNGNGLSDLEDIATGASSDADRDNVPDECQTELYCFGDGSGTACPCGNASVPGAQAGCRNSLSIAALLRSTGVPRISADDLVLRGSGMPNGTALYFQGTTRSAGGAGLVFGDGLRCAGGTVVRLATKTNVAGASRYPEVGDPPVSVRGGVPPAGGARTYQAWYRNAAPFCTPAPFNLTNGLEAVWFP